MNLSNLAVSLAIGLGVTAPTAFDAELNPFFDMSNVSSAPEVSERDVECLARNIYFEARGESIRGQEAVALVTMNRVLDENYPDTICDVVYQAQTDRRGNPIRDRCQFSWYCDGRSDVIRDQETYETSVEVARRSLSNRLEDFTHGAVNYHADYVRPRWAANVTRTAIIGQHIFYRP